MASADGLFADALTRLGAMLAEWSDGYALVGGIAVVARTHPRFTRDIDLVITVREGRENALLDLGHAHGFIDDPEETRVLLDGGLLRLWSHAANDAAVSIDLLFVDSPFLQSVVDRATVMDLGVAAFRVATPEDLVLLKLEAHRPHDIDDILALKDGCALDLAYVKAAAARLGLDDRYALYFT